MKPTRRELLALPLALTLPCPALAAEPSPSLRSGPRQRVSFQPLGTLLPEAELAAVVSAVQAFYAVTVQVLPAVPLPRSAFYVPRQRYRAEKLLEFLEERADPQARVTLGLTAVDISTSTARAFDWGILGLATLDGSSAVLSSFRCKRQAKSQDQVRARFAKTAVHELGHSFGLEHCPVQGCLMHDGEGSVLTTDAEHDLCADTRQTLARLGVLRTAAKSPFVPY